MNRLLDYFSQDSMAADAWAGKYQMKDKEGNPLEETPTDMHLRLAKEFGRIEKFYQEKENISRIDDLSDYGKKFINKRASQTKEEIINELFSYFDKFKWIVPQGSIMSNLGNSNVFGSLSNCFVIAEPEDSYGGIMRADEELAQLMKRRGGVGTNLSTLRPTLAEVTNTSKSSTGVPSFMERFSNTTREVAQEGRRGALMLLLHCQHPDIFKFVTIKDDRTKVTGANISVMFTDDFMFQVESEADDFICQFPIENEPVFEHEYQQLKEFNKLYKVSDKKYLMKIKPKELFDLVVEMAWKNAEPGVAYINRIQDYAPDGVYPRFKPTKCNPCVTGDTEILTKEDGYCQIQIMVNKEIEIWNGYEWSLVTPKITGYNQHMIKVTLSDGRTLTCTDYHKWILKDYSRIETINLRIGDKLPKYNFPYLENNEDFEITNADKYCYTQGFISADGQDNYNHLWLYEPKFICESRLDGVCSNTYTTSSGVLRKQLNLNTTYQDKSFVPFNWEIKNRLRWLSGLFDGDGTELIDGGLQLWSIDLEFLKNVQKLLTTLGTNSKILKGKDEEYKLLPNGKNEPKEYLCQKSYRICIGATEIQELKGLGLNCSRLKFDKKPNRSAQRFVTIVSIEDAGYADVVYCFNEPKNNSAIFNGILTAQCGEIWMGDYDACRLIAQNLFSVVVNPFTNNSYIDFDRLYEVSYMQQRISDALIDLEVEYIERIIEKIESDPEPYNVKEREVELWKKVRDNTRDGRRTGNGITAVGDMLAALNLSFDSTAALQTIEAVMHTKMKAELDCTIDMALLRGTFEGWNSSAEFEKETEDDRYAYYGTNSFYDMLINEFPEQATRMRYFGRRNVSWSTVAPTGTVSLMTQTTSGLEPLFKAYYTRRKKINPNDTNVRIDFTDQNGDTWQEYPILHQKFKDWVETNLSYCASLLNNTDSIINVDDLLTTKEEVQKLFEASPYYKSEAEDISWEARINMNSIIQKYTSNALSCTINLPKDVLKETIANIYFEGWKKGLKGITVYRDGSRSGVLVTEISKTIKDKFGYTDSIKRPKELEADYYFVTSKGRKYAVIIGNLEGNPYELFAFENPIEEKHIKGKIIKASKGVYKFISENYTIDNLQLSSEHTDEKLLTRFVSGMLRHGMNPKFIAEQVEKSEIEIVSFAKVICRILKRYIKDEVTSETCPECKEGTMIYQEGCKKCNSCSYSKC